MHELSLENTDAVWKHRLSKLGRSDKLEGSRGEGYWLAPFTRFQADCPYFVGSYQEAASLLNNLALQGVDTAIIDVPPNLHELEHLANVTRAI